MGLLGPLFSLCLTLAGIELSRLPNNFWNYFQLKLMFSKFSLLIAHGQLVSNRSPGLGKM